MENKQVLQATGIYKTFNNGQLETEVLKGIDLTVLEGEFLMITGPSGSGKSTLLYAISGLEKPTKGVVLINGVDITKANNRELSDLRQHKIGFVFQFYNLISTLTAYENILLASSIAKNPNPQIEELLEKVGLKEYKDYYPNQLSGGMQQRVAIARALVNNPDIIFADEPTGNLDSKNEIEILELLSKLNKEEHKTIVMVTHALEKLKYSTRQIQMKDGVIVC